ncbi:MAG: DUF559 domain-containing protein, partial [Nocardioidaceae bacterium]
SRGMWTTGTFCCADRASWGMEPRCNPPPELDGRPFTTREARDAGLTPDNLRASWVTRLMRGVFAYESTELTIRIWIRAALLVLPSDAALSHLTAMWWYGVEVGRWWPLHFSTNSALASRRQEILLHRRRGRMHPTSLSGVRVLGPDRTFVDCAAPRFRLSWVQLVQAGDRFVHLGHTRVATLVEYCDRVHLDGVQRARLAARYVRARVESPMETLVRLMLVCARLPEPACNREIRDAIGRFVARCDLVYERYRVIVEYDGMWHRTGRAQRLKDRRRIAALEALGWTVIVITAEDLADKQAVVRRVHRALVANGYDGHPPHFNAMWTKWFA